ncbi:hypothetical protein GV64_24555 [Endozoicomonas elysicola]|uniref:Sulfatase N-terminal domain-containing protein n=2 Tax=Endozoicomonas elysicola TaxID=305900 RepID=A0A081K595_9GAMM|nr:hypothetical protein GV64_24555 [Endozoicomonas elysicola]
MIQSDEHSPFLSSIEGHKHIQTPNLQKLADRGCYFQSHYTVSPLCCPARSSWFTGQRPHKSQVYNNSIVFPKALPTIGGILNKQGIYTVHIGKVDGHMKAEDMGYSEMHRLWSPSVQDPGDMNISRSPVPVRSLVSIDGVARNEMYGPVENPFKQDEPAFKLTANWLATKAIELDQPWFVSLNTSKPHFPCFTSEELWNKYESCQDLPEFDASHPNALHPVTRSLRDHFQVDQYDEKALRGIRRGYVANVDWLDSKIGELVAVLEETGQLDNTVIIYTSDHGAMMGEFGLQWKCSMHETSARVPLIITGPGFEQGVINHTATDSMDLQATIFKIFNAERPDEWDGEPIQSLTINDNNRASMSEFHGHGTHSSSYLIRRGDWKYVYHFGEPAQLFNIANDPRESIDAVQTAIENPQVVDDLHSVLLGYLDPDKEYHRAEAFINKQLEEFKTGGFEMLSGGHALRTQ